MIWLTWRQHRAEALVIGIALAALAILFIATGLDIRSTYHSLGVDACIANPNSNPDCNEFVRAFEEQYGALAQAVPWLNFVPALVAMLVGAPLVARELEQGTQRLVWTQSVTRGRWLAVKLALVVGGCLVVAALLTALISWWSTPFDALNGRFEPRAFDLEGIVPLAYMAFAVLLAVAAGALLRRSIPAMVLTLALFLAVRLPIDNYLRQHYQPPLTTTYSVLANDPNLGMDAWVVDSGFVDASGHHLSDDQVFRPCETQVGDPGLTKQSVFQCIAARGISQYIVYQPGDRYWTFQAIETALYAILAAALLVLTVYWVRRRLN
jgi:hypothetical protein